MHCHLHYQHSADLAYQLSIYQLQAVKCCSFKWALHDKKSTLKDKNMKWFSLFFLKHQHVFFFQIRHTVQHSKRVFFFNTSFGCWHLKTWTLKAPPGLKGQIIFYHTHTHRTVIFTYCRDFSVQTFQNIKGNLLYDYLTCFYGLDTSPFRGLTHMSRRQWPPQNILQRHKALHSSSPESYQSYKVKPLTSVHESGQNMLKTKYLSDLNYFTLQNVFHFNYFKHWLSTLSIKIYGRKHDKM